MFGEPATWERWSPATSEALDTGAAHLARDGWSMWRGPATLEPRDVGRDVGVETWSTTLEHDAGARRWSTMLEHATLEHATLEPTTLGGQSLKAVR